MSRALSMSKMDLALGAVEDPPSGCLYGFRDDVERVERTPGRAAQIGSLVHKLAECHLTGESVSMTDLDPEVVAEALALFNGPLKDWLEPWRGAYIEKGLRYDAEQDIARFGPRRGDEGYDRHGAMVLKGTLDLARIEAGEAWVVDLKSGKKENAHQEQLMAQAVAFSRLPVARTMDVRKVHVAFAFARKVRMPEVEYVTLNADDLDAAAGKIRRALRLLPTSQPQTGDYCWRCDARPMCPAWADERDAMRGEVA
jgi:hypothetical protein